MNCKVCSIIAVSMVFLMLVASATGYSSALVTSYSSVPSSSVPFPSGFASVAAPPTLELTAYLGLSPSSPAMLAQVAQAVASPGSPLYHHYQSQYSLEKNYGPTPAEYSSVVNYLKSQGLEVSKGPDNFSVAATGTVAQFEQALQTQVYILTNGTVSYYDTVGSYSLPSSIASYVTGVIGLENVTQAQPTLTLDPASGLQGELPLQAVSSEEAVLQAEGLVDAQGGPSQGAAQPPYTPQSTQIAYNETPILDHNLGEDFYTNGQFITVAVVDAFGDPTAYEDLAAYSAAFNVTNLEYTSYPSCVVNATASSVVGFPGYCNDVAQPTFSVLYPYGQPSATNSLDAVTQLWEIETALDIQMAHATAPGANIVSVVSPDAGVTPLLSVAYVIANGLANVVSMSFSYGATHTVPPAYINFMQSYFEMAAAEGITVLAASGDEGAYGYSAFGTNWPASDPWVTGVGGTTLYMNGAASAGTNPLSGPPAVPEVVFPSSWKNETAWTGYTGGGYSTVFQRPAWQVGEGLPTTGSHADERGVPDVAADGMFSGNYFFVNGLIAGSYLFGGTSFASPLVAGMVATMDSYLTNLASSFGFLGFADPVLYQVLDSPYYLRAIHDITTGNNIPASVSGEPGYYAGPGWNPVDGIGTFNVGVLVHILSQYSFSTGVYAGSDYAGNYGASVQIQTNIPQVLYGGYDLYYLTETLQNGAHLFIGYSEATQGSSVGADSWFYGVIPPGSPFETAYMTFGPQGSAGSNATWNTYTLVQSGGEWLFEFNGEVLYEYGSPNASETPPVALATTFGVTNTYNQLRAHFESLEATFGSGFKPVKDAYYITLTQVLDVTPAIQPFTNPYGLSVIKPDNWVAGSGLPVPANNTVLWSTPSSPPPPKPPHPLPRPPH